MRRLLLALVLCASSASAQVMNPTQVSGTTNQVQVVWNAGGNVISLVGPYLPTTFTTNGVIYGAGSSSLLATTQGPANSVLTANAGAPSFSATPTLTSLTLNSGALASRLNITESDGSLLTLGNVAHTSATITTDPTVKTLGAVTGLATLNLTANPAVALYFTGFNGLGTIAATDTANYITGSYSPVLRGGSVVATHSGTGTLPDMVGLDAIVRRIGVGAGNVTTTMDAVLAIMLQQTASGSVARMTGLYVKQPVGTAGGTVTNVYGNYIENMAPTAGTLTNTAYGVYQAGTTNYNYFGGKTGIGATTPTNDLSFGGNAARIIWSERHTTANTAGNSVTLQAGGATAAATNKSGGTLVLSGGQSTGSGAGTVQILTFPSTAGATTDNTAAQAAIHYGDGSMEIGTGSTKWGAYRLACPGGTAHVTGDFGLSAAWGANATVSAVTGNDCRFTVTVTTSALNTPTANPQVTLTFKDGAWPTAPYCLTNMDYTGTGLTGAVETHTATTTDVMEFIGTPTAITSATYIFIGLCLG